VSSKWCKGCSGSGEAAAESRLALRDALVVATAKVSGCEAIVGNDFTWAKIEVVPVILLDDYCGDRENP
jgi:predicted nucleic acid-binding protein